MNFTNWYSFSDTFHQPETTSGKDLNLHMIFYSNTNLLLCVFMHTPSISNIIVNKAMNFVCVYVCDVPVKDKVILRTY